ncbi:hypothetical protein CF319_g3251 [Tilletia indica]|nr:hypothetical protein CF319_g3251 [Tilletia indica]
MPPKIKPPKQKQPPTAEEIEALRAARAAKRELEVAQREADLQAARAVDRERVGKGEVPVDGEGRRLFVGREWAGVRGVREGGGGRRVRIVSWNILAQGLIQRKLFPNSDALKWRDRSPGLTAELVGHAFDVGCLQEVDRFEVHSETLKYHGYAYEYQRGYRAKKHGLAIVWRTIPRPDAPSVIFDPLPAGRALLYLDHASVSGFPQQGRTACSRETRNIALFVAIRFASEAGKRGGGGLIVATTHTFWHPKHSYERARQVGVLIRELDRFRRRPGAEWNGWDCVLAGDFNDQPDSMTYELATARPTLRSVAIEEVASSMVVHSSVDEKLNAPPVAGDGREERKAGLVEITSEVGAVDGMGTIKAEGAQGKKKKSELASNSNAPPVQADREAEEEDEEEAGAEEGEGEDEEAEAEAEAGEEHDDRMLKNCRLSRTSDGLLTLNELRQLYDLSGPPPSSEVEGNAYDAARYPDPRSQLDNSVKEGGVVGLQSAYGSFYNRLVSSSTEEEDDDKDGLEAGNFFGSPTRGRERWNDPDWTKSEHVGDGCEPMWTLYSALFSLTLDYVFLFPRNAPSPDEKKEKERSFYPEVTALLRTHRTEVLQPGTPRKYVNASDHVKIGAEIVVD